MEFTLAGEPYVHRCDLAFAIDHDTDSLSALRRIDVGAVGSADLPVGVADQRVVEVEFLGELLVVLGGVERDAEDHRVLPIVVGFEVILIQPLQDLIACLLTGNRDSNAEIVNCQGML